MVVVPLAILGWLGARLDAAERALRDDLFEQTIRAELEGYELTVGTVIAQWERDLAIDLGEAPIEPALLRERLLKSVFVTQYFVVDAQGMLRFPSYDGESSASEEESLNRTRDIWINRELTTQAAPEQAPAQQIFKGGKGGVMNTAPSQRLSGWYSWHWGNDIHLIYWLRRDDGIIVAAELNRPRLTADIIAALPDSYPDEVENAEVSTGDWALGYSEKLEVPQGRMELRNSQGEPLYVWDNYLTSETVKPRVAIPIRYPLSTWTLAYCIDPGLPLATRDSGIWYRLSTRLGAVAIALLGIAAYFYRESSREIREAAQRVSFVNQVSHELKTPLTNIRMYAEMLEENLDQVDEQSKRHVGVLVSESQRLSRLIGNILTFSRKERKSLTLRPARGIVDLCIQSVLAQFKPALDARGITVNAELHADQPAIIDADAIGQIVGNLVSNVEKYAAAGKSLNIASQQDCDRVSISLTDAGPGIPVKERKRVFDPFYRVSDKLTDGVAGTGIGLTIARDLARLHGGDLTLDESELGARFNVSLRCPLDGEKT